MRRRTVLVITVLALLMTLSACGDDDGSVFEGGATSAAESTTTADETTSTAVEPTTTSLAPPATVAPETTAGGGVAGHALGGLVSGALTEGAGTGSPALTGNAEACFTSGLVEAIGEDRFAELDALAAGADDMADVFSQMTDPEIDALVAVIGDCIDVEALLAAEMSGQELSPEVVACVAGTVSEEETLNALVRAMIAGDDPTTNPEFLAIMIGIMTEDCVGPMEDMLIEEFVASGISQGSATCLANEFLREGLFEALLDSMLSGGDFPTDPGLQSQMMAAFTSCLTPEELGNLGG